MVQRVVVKKEEKIYEYLNYTMLASVRFRFFFFFFCGNYYRNASIIPEERYQKDHYRCDHQDCHFSFFLGEGDSKQSQEAPHPSS